MESENAAVATIQKNSAEEVRISLSEYRGFHNLDVRTYTTFGSVMEARPTKKGVSLKLDKLDEFIVALSLARTEAVRLGLLEGGDA